MSTLCFRGLAVCSFFAIGLSAQSFSAGVKGGFPFTYSTNNTVAGGGDIHVDSTAHGFIAGGVAELGLPMGLSVEGDVLYHPYNFRNLGFIVGSGTVTNYNVFEVPIVGKLRLGKGLARPYAEAGPEFRFHPSSGLTLSRDGFVVGGGIELKLLLVKISPEIRYTRWASSSQIGSNPNQAAVLVGVTF